MSNKDKNDGWKKFDDWIMPYVQSPWLRNISKRSGINGFVLLPLTAAIAMIIELVFFLNGKLGPLIAKTKSSQSPSVLPYLIGYSVIAWGVCWCVGKVKDHFHRKN